MKQILYFMIIIVLLSACHSKKNDKKSENPFFAEYDTPFGVPPFEKINAKHFLPAIKEGIFRDNEDIKKITDNLQAPDFTNTIEALDYSGRFLAKVSIYFYNLADANTNDSIQKLMNEISPILTKHADDILLNSKLFERIKKVYETKNQAKLDKYQIRLLDKTYERFVRNGAALNTEAQKRLREINENLSLLSVKFSQNLLAETKAFKLVVEKKEDLDGLTENQIYTAADEAKQAKMEGKWIFTLDNACIMPFLTYSAKRDLREKMLKAYMNRGNNDNANDNKKVMTEIIRLRLEKAKLLGYESYAAFALANRMAKTPLAAMDLLTKLWQPATKVAKNEASDLQEYINKTGEKIKLEAWDWRYYSEKLRKERFNLDEEQIRPYLQLEKVRDGAFTVANKLYGISFSEIKDIPKYHSDVTAFEVKDTDNSHLGVLYLDFFPRASKRGGAWCTTFREQCEYQGKDVRPIVSIVCNFTKPTANTPSLLTFDEASTLFHEFGHALHSLLAKVKYPGLSGVARDYVELPSQIMENWAGNSEVFSLYAKHYKTGEVMPKELIEKMAESKLFNEGFAVTEYLAASLLDMDYHSLKEIKPDFNILEEENFAMKKIGLIPEILPRYRTTYFAHISDEGYAAGYHVYIWAQVLDADAFAAFEEKGIFDKTTANLFRKNILEMGGMEDEMQAYTRFRGKAPSIEPLLKRRGLKK